MVRNLRSIVLVGWTLTMTCAGTGIAAAAQPVDDTPGATFQSEKFRSQELGVRAIPSPYSRRVHAPELPGRHSFAYRRHVIARHHRY